MPYDPHGIDLDAFHKAAAAHGVVTPGDATASQWLDTWASYSEDRMATFKALAASFTDAVTALRSRLRQLVDRDSQAKAQILADEAMRAAALRMGAYDLADRLGNLVAVEKAYVGSEARRIRRLAGDIGLYDALDEGDDR